MTIAVQADPAARRETAPLPAVRIGADGKFLRAGEERFLVKGVTYGTFAPDADGYQFPSARQIDQDFRQMAEMGLNTVRVYTPPRRELLDLAATHGLRVMVGLPWSEHVAFLDDAELRRQIRRDLNATVRSLADHPGVLMFALGNEIPPSIVRWHGRVGIERYLRELYDDAKSAAPDALLTYVNFPPTEFLDLSFFDVCSFNVYLHQEPALRSYLARLQHIAGQKPFLLAEAGADSFREGEDGQAAITSMHIRAAFEEGACGAVAFAWTDEWWRGGFQVENWAFGLVDAERRPKPAATAVQLAFADAPFPAESRKSWPKVSVIVCAYNAGDTLEDNLQSLERLNYADYEIILVNDGSTDRTGEIARGHARVRVVDVPNSGLSAARNVGLAEASGEIVAYTDADTRVDPDWLTYLVQPFLTSDVVGSGGPNVVPPDDPPVAQCIARAPGGPTHVLLDDRIAEHVPGCNMAFRREALLTIGGFNPIYMRAGDDVDVCWRLQARGWKIGFSSSALVWHHHRASIKAYWRQQVGYGEGERWLMAHHPEKFLDGHMLWHGRIYSPLPFVRSMWGERINAGVWGTAAFPSVYRTDVHPFAFLPHSVRWQIFSLISLLAGIGVAIGTEYLWAAVLLLIAGAIGIASTITKNVLYALRSNVDGLPGSHLWYRIVVAYLHFIQPVARIRGQIRGLISPPEVLLPSVTKQTSRLPRPSIAEAWRALLLVSGTVTEDRFWCERWTSAERVLTQITTWLQRSHVRIIEVDDGWAPDRDVSILVGRWAWLDIRALVEDHGAGKGLLRLGTHLRPTSLGIVSAVALAAALLGAASAGVALRWPAAGFTAAALAIGLAALAIWTTAQTVAVVGRAAASVAETDEMKVMAPGAARTPIIAPSLLRSYGLRMAIMFFVMIVALGAGTFMLREAAKAEVVIGARRNADQGEPALAAWGDTPSGIAVSSSGSIYFADSHNALIWRHDPGSGAVVVAGNRQLGAGFSGDFGSALAAQLNTPDGVCIAPDGDLVLADSQNQRIRRIDKQTQVIMTVAGSGRTGYDGDGRPAIDAALNDPNAVACASDGSIYLADTLNYRVRMIDPKTGLIDTVAGDGTPGEQDSVGDGGPATLARLNMPSDLAVAPNGDLYIADMHHNRIRKVDARTHVITTVAGNGAFGAGGDGGPATQASLAGPAGVALAAEPRGGLSIYIADYYNSQIRVVGPDGMINSLTDDGSAAFGTPTRVAFEPKSRWLYVADSSRDQVVAFNVPRPSSNRLGLPQRPFGSAPRRPTP